MLQRAFVFLAFAFAAVLARFAHATDGEVFQAPEVGDVAPPLAGIGWLQLDSEWGGNGPDLLTLRGKVVIVTSFGYYCDSCVRVGVPLANALRDANPGELCVISFTGPWGEDSHEQIVDEARKLGIRNAIGWSGYFGEETPYLNLNSQPGLTNAYVISRTGVVVWKGDPSTDREGYLEAAGRALRAPKLAPIDAALAPELDAATRAYGMGEPAAVPSAVQAALQKVGGKSTPAAQRVRDDGAKLLGLLDASREKLMEELERSGGAADGEVFQRVMPFVRRAFPKSDASKRCDDLEMFIAVHTDKGPENRAWAQWYELDSRRPPTFPVLKDKAGLKYAKELAKRLKQGGCPAQKRAEEWLQRFEAASELD